MQIKNNYLAYSFLCLYFALLIYTSNYHGLTWDEPLEYLGLIGQLKLATSVLFQTNDYHLSDIPSDLSLYGIGFKIWPYAFSKILSLLINGDVENIYYIASHIAIAVLTCITMIGIYKAIEIHQSKEAALFSIVALALIPSWTGSAFFNVKDIPFAAFYTILTSASIIYLKNNSSKARLAMLIAAGHCLGIKAITIIPILITYIFVIFITRKLLLIDIIAFCFIGFIYNPSSWSDPILWAKAHQYVMTNHHWQHCTKILDSCIYPKNQDWSALLYILDVFYIKWPLFLLIFLISSMRFIKYSPAVILVILQLTILPVGAIVKNSTLYDMDRHLLFIYPGLILFTGLSNFITLNPKTFLHKILIAFTLIFMIITSVDMYKLHPYEYIYANEFTRMQITSYNTVNDYWGYSIKELSEYIDDNAIPIFAEPPHLAYHAMQKHIKQLHNCGMINEKSLVLGYTRSILIQDCNRDCAKIVDIKRSMIGMKAPLVLSSLFSCDP